MSKKSPSGRSGKAEEDLIKLYLEQAEICCEQAREATRRRRFDAARGLFATAVALCRRALAATGVNGDIKSNQQLQQQVERISSEMAAHSLLARSMQRPLRASAAPSSTQLALSKHRRLHP
jgi:lipopolysaccharide biosynthesis regulator YciM